MEEAMKSKSRPSPARRIELVSASDLAQLGFCERVVHLDWRYGEERSPVQIEAQNRGNLAHARFYEDSKRIADTSQTKGKCFVATMALGECRETNALRAFRDLYLRRSKLGRWWVGAYYRYSPALCEALKTRPFALDVVTKVVLGAAKVAEVLVERKMR